MNVTAHTNFQELRRQLDLQQIPTYHENPDTRDLPVLIAVGSDSTKVYVVVGKDSFLVSLAKFAATTSTKYTTVDDAFSAILRLRHSI